jgi:hypothetical protein
LQGDQSFGKLPDLLLVDGGKPKAPRGTGMKAMKIDILSQAWSRMISTAQETHLRGQELI